jgi:hypothetical protein
MLSIVIDLGLNPTGARDSMIAIACLAMAFYGNDIFSWSYKPQTDQPFVGR